MEANKFTDWLEENGDYSKGEDLGVSNVPVLADYDLMITEAREALGKFMSQAKDLLSDANSLEIVDEATAAQGAEYKALSTKIIKKIDGRVKEILEEPRRYISNVGMVADGIKGPLSEAKAVVDNKILIWSQKRRIEQEKQAREAREAAAALRAKLDEEAKAAGVEPVVIPEPVAPPAKMQMRTESGTTYEFKQWKGVIIKPEHVPREYCAPSQQLINAAVKRGVRKIDGVEITEKSEFRSKTK